MATRLPEKREALKFATIDSTVALMFALLINASILILAAATFHKAGMSDVAELGEAHSLLAPLLGLAIAPTLFGIALLCCGINSTVTATLAGQIVMEGFLNIRLPPWLRRLITRAIAIVPAAIVTIWYGESGTAQLLILTQVVLSLQLSFAVFPLVMFTADRAKMGALVAPRWLIVFAGADRGGDRRPQRQAAGRLRDGIAARAFCSQVESPGVAQMRLRNCILQPGGITWRRTNAAKKLYFAARWNHLASHKCG